MSQSPIHIVGAGLAGLIAANVLRRHDMSIFEKQDSVPHNHNALLRFRSEGVSNACGIPFRKVLVRKGIWDGTDIRNETTIRTANNYSTNISDSKDYGDRSVWGLEPETRWLAPDCFQSKLANKLPIYFSHEYQFHRENKAVISTLPMPAAMRIFCWAPPVPLTFKFAPIWVIRFNIDATSDAQQTVYNGSGEHWWYRATLQGNEVIIECMSEPDGNMVRSLLRDLVRHCFCVGARIFSHTVYRQEYGKMFPIDETIRKSFIRWLTLTHGVYSLGRFATWRKGLLLDDIVKDANVIDSLIHNECREYDSSLA